MKFTMNLGNVKSVVKSMSPNVPKVLLKPLNICHRLCVLRPRVIIIWYLLHFFEWSRQKIVDILERIIGCIVLSWSYLILKWLNQKINSEMAYLKIILFLERIGVCIAQCIQQKNTSALDLNVL